MVAANTKDTPEAELIHSAPGLFPDVLLERFPIVLEPGKTLCLWITVNIPPDAAPGIHRAQVVVCQLCCR